jgi:hypothetical protein
MEAKLGVVQGLRDESKVLVPKMAPKDRPLFGLEGKYLIAKGFKNGHLGIIYAGYVDTMLKDGAFYLVTQVRAYTKNPGPGSDKVGHVSTKLFLIRDLTGISFFDTHEACQAELDEELLALRRKS